MVLYTVVSLILSKSGTGFGLLLFGLLYLFTKKGLQIFNYLIVSAAIILMVSFYDLLIEIFNAVMSRFAIRAGGFSEVFDQSLQFYFGSRDRRKRNDDGLGYRPSNKVFGLLVWVCFCYLCFFRVCLSYGYLGLFLSFLCLFTQLPVSNWIILMLPFIFLYRPIKD